jgi:hypothetical protein
LEERHRRDEGKERGGNMNLNMNVNVTQRHGDTNTNKKTTQELGNEHEPKLMQMRMQLPKGIVQYYLLRYFQDVSLY